MARVSATQERATVPTPYVDLDRAAWSRLRENHPMSLEQRDLAGLREDPSNGVRRIDTTPPEGGPFR